MICNLNQSPCSSSTRLTTPEIRGSDHGISVCENLPWCCGKTPFPQHQDHICLPRIQNSPLSVPLLPFQPYSILLLTPPSHLYASSVLASISAMVLTLDSQLWSAHVDTLPILRLRFIVNFSEKFDSVRCNALILFSLH